MSFPVAVSTCLRKYADFSGRARRSEFWYFFLFTFIVNFAVGFVAGFLEASLNRQGILGPLLLIAQLALILPTLAVGSRRLHDTGRSGWWQSIFYVPAVVSQVLGYIDLSGSRSLRSVLGLLLIAGLIVLIVFLVQKSADDNQYGPAPVRAGVYEPSWPAQPEYGPPSSAQSGYEMPPPAQPDYGTPPSSVQGYPPPEPPR